MSVVFDASAMIATLLDEADTSLRRAAIGCLAIDSPVVPHVWPVEVAGALAKAEWLGRISEDTCRMLWRDLRSWLSVASIAEAPAFDAHFEICRRFKLRGADACYLELAIRERLPLLTGDKALAEAAHAARVDLVFDPNA